MGAVLIDLSIYIKITRIRARLNSIFNNIFRGNEGKNTILSIVERAAYNNSEGIYILSGTGEFDNDINKSYNNIT